MTPEQRKLAARKELARRELARRESAPQQPAKLPDRPMTITERFQSALANVGRGIDTGVDVATSIASTIPAEIAGGIAGIGAQNIFNPLPTPDERTGVINTVRDALTVEPRTEEGRQALMELADIIMPYAEKLKAAENYLGDTTLEKTGSPALAAAAYTLPAAAMELAGMKGATAIPKTADKVKNIPVNRNIKKGIQESAPSNAALKSTSDSLFKEIDEMGVTVKPDAFAGLTETLRTDLAKAGISPKTTPTAAGAFEEVESAINGPLTLSKVEELREIAKGAAASTNRHEAKLGVILIDRIDNFLEDLTPDQLLTGKHNANKVGVKYKQAREKWGRYRRSEAVDKAVRMGSHARSGWENGMRQEFAKILKKIEDGKLHGFKDHEIAAIRRISDGTVGSNIFRELGKSGLAYGNLGNNWLGAFLTGGAAYQLGGPVATIAAVGAGTAFKKLALRMTKGNAHFADAVVRAGDDGEKIVEAYYRFTPKKQRSPEELSLLLMHQDVDLRPLKQFKLEAEAAKLAAEKRAQLAGALAPGATVNPRELETEQQ